MDTARVFIPITNYKHYIFSYFLFKEMLKKSTDKKSDRVLAVQAFHVLPSILLRYGTKNIEGKEHIIHIKKVV